MDRRFTSAVAQVPVVILCGGQGLRLRPVISDRPKCLAPIGGRPFLEMLLKSLACRRLTKAVCCLGYGSGQVEEFLRNYDRRGMEITWSVEAEPLGTGGALKNAQRLITEPCFLVVNGDTILEADYERLIEAHRRRGAVATLALWRCSSNSARYGRVEMDDMGRITGFSEKSAQAAAAGSPWISGGVYAFSQEVFARIAPGPPAVSLETQVFPSLIGAGLYGFPCEGYFLDIGIPEDYERAQHELPGRFLEC